jgi:cleavage and polyadenylation specificity factor subunit 2
LGKIRKTLKRISAQPRMFRSSSRFQKVPEEVPSKYVSTIVEVQLACRLLFVDLEGLNDGRAIKTIIPKVARRKLVSLS